MKKMMKIFAAAFVAIVAVSCVKENMENGGQNSDVKMVEVTFGADINADEEAEGKAHIGYDGNTPVMHWTKGDKVAVVDMNTSTIYEFTLCGGENTSNGMFTGQLPETSIKDADGNPAENQNWAILYPYSAIDNSIPKDIKIDGNKYMLDAILPVQQHAVNNGIAEGVNMLVCARQTLEEGVLMFPIVNFLKIEIQGTGLTSLEVFSNSNASVASAVRPQIANNGKDTGSYLNAWNCNRFSNKVELIPAEGQETIAPGTYYLVCRNGFQKGMTLKFTNVDGRMAYYSSDADPNVANRNMTIDLKAWDMASLNWKNEEIVTIDFASQPFVEELPTDNTAATGSYTLPSNQKKVNIMTTAIDAEKTYVAGTNRGLLFRTAGDYIEFPAIAGKKLKEVKVETSYESYLMSCVTDAEGKDMTSGDLRSYHGNTLLSHVLPKSEINKPYRLMVRSVSDDDIYVRLQKVTLVYVGDDVAEISGVEASAVNAFDGFTVTGAMSGVGLDAASWGIEYGTSVEALTEVATGDGGVINQFVAAASGTYYVRIWASADGGKNKTYSEVVTVEVKSFSGTITFDFALTDNITIVGTSSGNNPITTVNKNRTFVGEDYYSYTTSEGVYPFTVYSYWNKTEGKRTNISKDGTLLSYCVSNGGRFRCSPCNASYPVWLSIPKVAGYKLTLVTYYANNDSRAAGVDSCATLEESVIASAVCQDKTEYRYTIELADKEISSETQYYFRFLTNGYYSKIIFEYEKVN